MKSGPERTLLYALCGSLRKASANRFLIEALRDLAPPGVAIEICDLIGDLPIFNPDLEGEDTPQPVLAFAAKIKAADGLIIASPEYAHGIPGGLKNALDWLVSRDEIPHKPVMLAHASYRGDHVLEALTEILTTMSVALVDNAFCRVDLIGKPIERRREIVEEADTKTMLVHGLNRFVAGIAAGKTW
jgi:chromate reductase, NAD(P)H dehydrogenase (quinone)